MTPLPSSVRARVAGAAVVAVAGVLIVVGWALVVNHRRELTENLDERMSAVADALGAELERGSAPSLDRLADDEWVGQVILDEDVVEASASLGGAPIAAPQASGQRSDDVGPLPGGDDPMRLLRRAVAAPDRPVTLVVAAPRDDIIESVDLLRRSMYLAVPVASVVLGASTWLLVGMALRPVERLRAEVAAIGGDELERRVPVPGTGDEVERLAVTMNEMLGRAEQAQVRQRRFVADASHELRSPLTRMRTELEVDLAHPATADERRTHESVLAEVLELQRLVDDLLLLARADDAATAPDAATAELAAVAAVVVHRVRPPTGITVRLVRSAAPVVLGRDDELARAVGNLVDNAVRHATSTVVVRIEAGEQTATVAVEDDGPGIVASERERIFERFARLDEARSADAGGTGLGLSIARHIVERRAGTIVVDPAPGRGARFVVTLPLAGGPPSGPAQLQRRCSPP